MSSIKGMLKACQNAKLRIVSTMGLLVNFVPLMLTIASVILYLAIKNLILSPLAGFPGPWLAAFTRWYETYFDVFCDGQFMYEIQRLHTIYGPVVRISPNEIHVNNADFYDTLYAGPTRCRYKDPWFLSSIAPGTSFSASHASQHRARRGGLSPFFSKKAVRACEPLIHSNIDLLCSHARRAQHTGGILELHTYFVNFAVDTLSQYVFGEGNQFAMLKEARLSDKWKKGVNGIFECLLMIRHFPWLYNMSRVFPSLSSWISPQFSNAHPIENVCIPFL
jgi:cytochrome P450